MRATKRDVSRGEAASIGGTSTPPCDACGSREVSADGRCVYCATARTLFAPLGKDESRVEDVESALALARQRVLRQLEAEINFLNEQYRDTGHPGIPVKIANAKLKLEKLMGTDNNG